MNRQTIKIHNPVNRVYVIELTADGTLLVDDDPTWIDPDDVDYPNEVMTFTTEALADAHIVDQSLTETATAEVLDFETAVVYPQGYLADGNGAEEYIDGDGNVFNIYTAFKAVDYGNNNFYD